MTKDKEAAIEMYVGGLVLDPNTQAPVVILKDETGDVVLPIWIGLAEATSIASAIKEIDMARPLTHDLMYDVLNQAGVEIRRIVITELKDKTYYAELVLSLGNKALIIDARPSDAIALGIRASAPIYVAEEVLKTAQVAFQEATGGSSQQSAESAEEVSGEEEEASGGEFNFNSIDKEKWDELLDELDPEDFKYKM